MNDRRSKKIIKKLMLATKDTGLKITQRISSALVVLNIKKRQTTTITTTTWRRTKPTINKTNNSTNTQPTTSRSLQSKLLLLLSYTHT